MEKKININYEGGAAAMPLALLKCIESASKTDIRILVAALSCASMGGFASEEVIRLAGVDEKQLSASIKFWTEKGLFSESAAAETEEIGTKNEDTKIVGATVKRSDEVPNYSPVELSVILERRKEASHFIDECQRLMGKMFNTHEINIILGLADYFGLEWEYIMTVISYCGQKGKRSVKYAEKLAISMSDSGIETVEELIAKLAELDAAAENENCVRSLFGMKARALTAKEKKFIGAWFGKMGYNIDIVSRAYEITVNATGEASVPYTNAILERWSSEGLQTLEEIDASIEKKKNEVKSESAGSFDTDDFFEAALRRSFDDKKA